MSNYQTGHEAEKDAAEYIKSQGFKILILNWKTRFCEIDIVAEKHKVVYFVEVKQRKNTLQGYGHDYITSKKLAQMQRAAKMWVHENRWQGSWELSVISIDAGKITFFESIDI